MLNNKRNVSHETFMFFKKSKKIIAIIQKKK